MQFDFACSITEEDDGKVHLIRCRDIPELLSWAEDGESDETWARYAVMDCIAFMMKDGVKIASATASEEGEFVVRLSLSATLKIFLHNAMVERGLSCEALGEMLGTTARIVKRLLNVNQTTNVDTLVDILGKLGYEVHLDMVPKA